jgi:hypothetical protein
MIRAEVEGDVANMPIYQALRLLRVGQSLPQGGFAKVKLDRQWLNDTYGEGIEDRLPKGVPPIVSNNDTMDADHVAQLTGFESGDELVKALLDHEAKRQAAKAEGENRSPRQKEVDDRVAERMKEEVGDPFAHLEEEAQDAVASDRQADLMSMEVRALARKTGQKPTPWKLAKEWAAKRVGLETAREAISGRAIQGYARAIAKAGREYEEFLVAGDFEEAFRAKQRQLLNMALLSEAKKAANDVDAAVRRMQKLAGRDHIPSVDQDYLEQAHALLADVDLKSNYKQSDRASAFAEWHARQVELGVLPVVPPGYRELLGRTHWSKLSVPELLELDKAVGQIVELGRLKQKLRDGLAQRDFEEGDRRAGRQRREQKTRKEAKTWASAPCPSASGQDLRSADAAMLKMEQMAKWLDGDASDGPWTRLVFNIMSDAQGREQDLLRSYVTEINAIIKALPGKTGASAGPTRSTPPSWSTTASPRNGQGPDRHDGHELGQRGQPPAAARRLRLGGGQRPAGVRPADDQRGLGLRPAGVGRGRQAVARGRRARATCKRTCSGEGRSRSSGHPARHLSRRLLPGGLRPGDVEPGGDRRGQQAVADGGFMQVTTRAGATQAALEAVKDRPICSAWASSPATSAKSSTTSPTARR